jgi:DNA-directed RNA polymerase sigma subunit (sigma70/sigma32)
VRAKARKRKPQESRATADGRLPEYGAIRTVEEVGRLLGISKGRVSQLERSAFRKLREFRELKENL